MPRRCAYSFIIWANAASVPPTRSASAMVASFPDCTIMPLTRMSTGICVPTGRKVRDPSARQACSLMVTRSVSFSLPSASARKTTYAVMSLVRLAGLARAAGWILRQPPAAEMIDQQVGARIDLGGVGYRAGGLRGQRDPGERGGEQ